MKSKEDTSIISISNILKAFRYWPRIFKLLWNTSPIGFICIMILNLFHGISPIIVLLLTERMINSITYSWTNGYSVALWAFALMVGFIFISEILNLFQSYIENLFKVLFSNKINILIMKKSTSLSLKDFENSYVQDSLKLAQSEAGHRPYEIMQQILFLTSSVVTLISAIGMLVVFKWWMAFLLLIMPITSFYSFLTIGQKEFLIHYKRVPKMRKTWYLSFLMTNDKNFKEVKIYNLGEYLLNKYSSLFNSFYQEDRGIAKKRLIAGILFQIVNQIAYIFMMLFVLKAAFLKEIEIGTVVALIQTITMTQSNSQSLISGLLSLCQHNLYLKQLFVFLDFNTVKSKKNKHYNISSIESIEFKNVSFKYAGNDKYAIQDVSFKLRRGETLAIVGKNGAGKTTLIKLLTQLYSDFEGDILINGISVRLFDEEILRKHIGVVFQDFIQYELKMRYNIGFGNVDKLNDDKELLEAAESAGIDPLIEKLPNKLDTQVGRLFEQGYQLSGGQWQRVAIARAFMRKADIYILDEPSSMLDPEAETQVFEKFKKLINNNIGIFISHRYTAIKYADHILMMNKGKIEEQGSHEELMKKNGMYASLYNMQVSAYKDLEKSEV